jgi:hypothetical protein
MSGQKQDALIALRLLSELKGSTRQAVQQIQHSVLWNQDLNQGPALSAGTSGVGPRLASLSLEPSDLAPAARYRGRNPSAIIRDRSDGVDASRLGLNGYGVSKYIASNQAGSAALREAGGYAVSYPDAVPEKIYLDNVPRKSVSWLGDHDLHSKTLDDSRPGDQFKADIQDLDREILQLDQMLKDASSA